MGALLKLALLGHCALHRPAVHRASAVDHREASRLLDEHLDDRLGAAEVIGVPPFVVGRDDRQRSDAVRALRDLRHARRLVVAARAGLGLASAEDSGRRRSGNERERRRGEERVTLHDEAPFD